MPPAISRDFPAPSATPLQKSSADASENKLVEAGFLNSLVACTRATRYLPAVKGLSALLRVYNAVLPHPCMRRISDFDGDLLLDVSLRDSIGINLWHAPEQYERRERRLFCSAIRSGSVVLDIGANIGLFTLLAAKRGASVFSVEADPENAAQLHHHVSLNGLDLRVRVIEMTAADAETGPTPVRGSTIDSLHLPPVDLCKIDVAGFESRVLRGMTATLDRSPNLELLVEYSEPHGKDAADELLRFLMARFDRIDVVGGPRLDPGAAPPPYCNLWCSSPSLVR